jgi:hypothetical protein
MGQVKRVDFPESLWEALKFRKERITVIPVVRERERE